MPHSSQKQRVSITVDAQLLAEIDKLTEGYPRQAEIYLVRALKSIGDTKKRPAVVVSINILKNALQVQYKPWQYIFS